MIGFKAVLSFVFIVACLAAVPAGAMGENPAKQPAAKEEAKAAAPAAEAPQKEFTRSEMLTSIKDNLDNFDEISNFIPDLKKQTDSANKSSYTFQGKPLEDLDKETLKKLFGRIRNEAVRIRTERVNKQLEFIRKIEQFNRQNRQMNSMRTPSIPRPIPTTPKLPTTPSVPKIQKIPKTPSY